MRKDYPRWYDPSPGDDFAGLEELRNKNEDNS
jgi:hypothetical protein